MTPNGNKNSAQPVMDFSVDSSALLDEISMTQNVLERKSTIPILSNFLFEASGNSLMISATDHEISLRTSCAARVRSPGSCTVPGRKLYDYIRLLAEGEVAIKTLPNEWVDIRSGRSVTKLVGLSRKNFPALPLYPAKAAIRLPVATVQTMIEKTVFAISREESRYTLNGALLVLHPARITMVTTDGNRLAHVQADIPINGLSGEMRVLIPKKALREINTLLSMDEAQVFEFAKDNSTLYFRIGRRLLACRQLVGNFPNYESVMPRDYRLSVTLPCGEISQAVQRVSQLCEDSSSAVKVDLKSKQFSLSSSNPNTGEAEEILNTDYAGEPMTSRFHARFLSEFLKAAGTDNVQFYFKDSSSAAELRPVEALDHQYRYIVMPMRA